VTLRRVLIGTTIAVVLAVLFGPLTVAQVTGRPLVLDCGDLEPADCEVKMIEHAEIYESDGYGLFGWGPVTHFTFESIIGECGSITIERGTFTFGVLAMTAQLLC
jgi:hypothetical protein